MEILYMETCHFWSVSRLRLWSIDNIRKKDKRANDPKNKVEAASPLGRKWALRKAESPLKQMTSYLQQP
tara:strand:+ start:293 stop:499 length:207 start_codon:yes stop_codon:yes gene_type:complete